MVFIESVYVLVTIKYAYLLFTRYAVVVTPLRGGAPARLGCLAASWTRQTNPSPLQLLYFTKRSPHLQDAMPVHKILSLSLQFLDFTIKRKYTPETGF